MKRGVRDQQLQLELDVTLLSQTPQAQCTWATQLTGLLVYAAAAGTCPPKGTSGAPQGMQRRAARHTEPTMVSQSASSKAKIGQGEYTMGVCISAGIMRAWHTCWEITRWSLMSGNKGNVALVHVLKHWRHYLIGRLPGGIST